MRSRIQGTALKPRLCVYRSLKHIYAQLIDDVQGKTLVSAQDREIKEKASSAARPELADRSSSESHDKKVDLAREVGKLLAKKALGAKIETVVFDRGGFRYHGRVKALAEGAREGGLKF